MVYSLWLFGLAIFFFAVERLKPSRSEQAVLRRGFWQDLAFLIFNSEYLGLLVGLITVHVARIFDPLFGWQLLREQPLWLQLPMLVVALDFAQWVAHNLMHRIPWLWEFHKLHHSTEEMDWLSNWRFHGLETLVYRSVMYVPAALLGFSPEAMFCFGVINTFFGHFAHMNAELPLGPLRYLFNNPVMHRWHHVHAEAGPIDRNFGVVLSVWDWMFGTAYMPGEESPRRLGFAGIENYPRNIWGRLIAPFLNRGLRAR
jgi:sterol desaturase/sphingolipid hydroxylase (fatty acid hydroxylase superfamily)